MKNQEFKKYVYSGITAVSVIGVCILFWYCIQNWDLFCGMIKTILGIAAPIIYGAVLAYLMTPIYNRTFRLVKNKLCKGWKNEKHSKGIAKVCATVVSLLVVLIIILGLFQLIIPQIFDSIIGIKNSFPMYLQNLNQWLQNILSDNPEIETVVMNNLQYVLTMTENWMERFVSNIDMNRLGEILTGFSTGVMSLVVFIKNWLIGLIVMIYLLNIKEVFAAQGKKMIYSCMSLKWANSVVAELRFVNKVFGGFIIGKLLDSLIIGILCFICISMMKMPFVVLISVIIGVTNVIPFFGPFIGAIPCGFLVLLVSPVQCLYFILFIVLLQQFDGNILGPKILSDSTGLSSFWVLFSILIFGGLFGFIGMIIAVPSFAVIYDLIARAVNHSLQGKRLSRNTKDYEKLDYIDERNKNYINKSEQ